MQTFRTTINVFAILAISQTANANPANDLAVLAQVDRPEIVSDAIDRIAQVTNLPMLTQRVAAASCAVTSGVDVEEAHNVLEEASTQFEAIIFALRDGNAELNIFGPEPRSVLGE